MINKLLMRYAGIKICKLESILKMQNAGTENGYTGGKVRFNIESLLGSEAKNTWVDFASNINPDTNFASHKLMFVFMHNELKGNKERIVSNMLIAKNCGFGWLIRAKLLYTQNLVDQSFKAIELSGYSWRQVYFYLPEMCLSILSTKDIGLMSEILNENLDNVCVSFKTALMYSLKSNNINLIRDTCSHLETRKLDVKNNGLLLLQAKKWLASLQKQNESNLDRTNNFKSGTAEGTT